jgi:hypothetical protein
MKLNRHCERSEAIHRAAWAEWIASSLSLLAMTVGSYFISQGDLRMDQRMAFVRSRW